MNILLIILFDGSCDRRHIKSARLIDFVGPQLHQFFQHVIRLSQAGGILNLLSPDHHEYSA